MKKLRVLLFFFLIISTGNLIAQSCIWLYSPAGTDDQQVCLNSPILNIVYRLDPSVTGVSLSSGSFPAGVSGNLSGSYYTISGTPSATGLFQYELTVTGCVGTTTAKGSINVNGLPVASASSNSPICEGNTIYLFGSGSGTIISYSWIGPNGFTSTEQNPSITNASILNSGTYALSVTNSDNCIGQSATAVLVNSVPVITFTCSDPDNIICRGSSVTFTATGGTNYNFRVGGVSVQNGPSGSYTTTTLTNGQVVDVVVSNTGGCSTVSDGITMTVNPLPIPSLTSSDADNIFCAGTSVTFTAGGGSSYNFRINGVTVQSGPSNTYTTTSLLNGQIIDVVVTNSFGCSATSAGIINTVNPIPVAVISSSDPDNTFCAGTSVTFTASGGASYNFRVAGISVQNSSSNTYTTSTLTNGQAVDVIVTSVSGCSATSSPIINTVLPLPVPAISSSDPDNIFCYGTSVTFTATGGVGYNFRINGTSVQSGTSNTFTTSTLTNGQTVDVIVTNANGCTATSSGITNTVNPVPGVVASNNGPLCEGTALRLTGMPSSMAGYSWTGPNGYTSAEQNPVVSQSATVQMSGLYTLTVTSVNGCQGIDTTNVRVYAIPVSNAGSGGTECDLDFVLNAVPSVGTGLWTVVSGPVTGSPPVFIPDSNTPDATVIVSTYGTYTFRWTETNGPCTSSSVVTVNFYQQPVADPGAGGDACGLSYLLSAVPSAGLGTWSMISGTGTVLFTPNPNSATATATVSEYGTKVFKWKETNGICSDSSTITVNYYQQPVADPGTGGNICGLSFNLQATPSVGTGTWTRDSGPGTVNFSPDANTPNATVSVTAYGEHIFRWTEVNGTCTSGSTIAVTFVQQPSANAGSGGNECDKDFVLNAVPGSGTGTWTMISGPGQATFSPNANQPNATVTVTQFGSYDFAWTEVNEFCSSSDIIRVGFHDLPQISAGEDVAVCKGGSVQLNALGAGLFLWTPAAGLNNPAIPDPVASPDVTTAYTVTLTDQYGCKNSDQIIVDVREQPVADAGPDQDLQYIFETRLSASEPGFNESGEWIILSGSGTFSDANDHRALVSDLALGENILIWSVTNGACLPSVDTVKIMVNDLIIPTLITPNMDGINDYFVIEGIETYGKTSLIVFNRWGAMVYENYNYDNTWDGINKEGDPLPEDTYFIILTPENGRSRNGYVVIRR